MDINVNNTGRNEHVSAIERFIQTMKEKVQAIANELPFKTYHHRLLVKKVYNSWFG